MRRTKHRRVSSSVHKIFSTYQPKLVHDPFFYGFSTMFSGKGCMAWEQLLGQTKEVAGLWIYLIIPTVYSHPFKAFLGWI
jgi:hypothetical protein